MNPLLHSARYDVLLKPTGLYAERMRQRERHRRREARLAATASAAASVMNRAAGAAQDAGAAGATHAAATGLAAPAGRRDSLDLPSPLPLNRGTPNHTGRFAFGPAINSSGLFSPVLARDLTRGEFGPSLPVPTHQVRAQTCRT